MLWNRNNYSAYTPAFSISNESCICDKFGLIAMINNCKVYCDPLSIINVHPIFTMHLILIVTFSLSYFPQSWRRTCPRSKRKRCVISRAVRPQVACGRPSTTATTRGLRRSWRGRGRAASMISAGKIRLVWDEVLFVWCIELLKGY